MPGIRRPYQFGRKYPLGRVCLGVSAVVVYAVTEVLVSVRCYPVLDQRAVLRVLGCLAQVQGVHIEEVGILHIHTCQTVRRHICPVRIFFLLVGGVVCQLLSGDFIAEMICQLLACGFPCRICFLLGALDVEFQDAVVFRVNADIAYRQVLGIERVTNDFGNLHRELVHVEYRLGLSRFRVRYIILCPVRCLPCVQKLISVTEPDRSYGSGKNHLANALGGESLCQLVVRRAHHPLLTALRHSGDCQECQCCRTDQFLVCQCFCHNILSFFK